MQKFRVLPLL